MRISSYKFWFFQPKLITRSSLGLTQFRKHSRQTSTPIILGNLMAGIGHLTINIRIFEALIFSKDNLLILCPTLPPNSNPIEDNSSLRRSNLLP